MGLFSINTYSFVLIGSFIIISYLPSISMTLLKKVLSKKQLNKIVPIIIQVSRKDLPLGDVTAIHKGGPKPKSVVLKRNVKQKGGASSYRSYYEWIMLGLLIFAIHYMEYTKKCKRSSMKDILISGLWVILPTIFIYFSITRIGIVNKLRTLLSKNVALQLINEIFDGALLFVIYNMVNNITRKVGLNKCKKYSTDVADLKTSMTDAIEDLQTTIDEMKVTIDGIIADREALQTQIDSNDTSISDLQSQINILITENSTNLSIADIKDLQSQIDSISNNLSGVSLSDISDLQAQIDIINSESSVDSTSAIADLQSQIDSINSGSSVDSTAEITELQSQIVGILDTNVSLQLQIDELLAAQTAQQSVLSDHINLMEESISELTIIVSTNTETISQYATQIIDLLERIEILESTDTSTDISGITLSVNELTADYASMLDRIETLESAIDEINEKIDTINSSLEDINEDLLEEDVINQDFEDRLSALENTTTTTTTNSSSNANENANENANK